MPGDKYAYRNSASVNLVAAARGQSLGMMLLDACYNETIFLTGGAICQWINVSDLALTGLIALETTRSSWSEAGAQYPINRVAS